MSRAIGFVLLLALVGLFALLNWPAFAARVPLSFGFFSVDAPLGLLLLGLIGVLCVLFTAWVVYLQANALRDARRQTRELQTQRDLADQAEASRFIELRAELLTRLDRLHTELRVVHEQSANTVAAHLGELEDRMERARLLPPER